MGQIPADATPLPPTSLIICSRNRPELLLETVESVLGGDEVPAEIVVVDQSASPHAVLPTLPAERGCAIRYVWTRTTGLSRATNIGVAAAAHDCLVFTHDDVLVDPAWFGTLVRSLAGAGARSVVTGQVRPAATDVSGSFVPSTVTRPAPATYSGRVGEDVLYPMNMAMYRSAPDEVGPFDERLGPGTPFPAAEDNDFCYRLLEAGYRILYVPGAALTHRAWRSGREYLPLRWNYGSGQGAFYAKYVGLRDRYMLGRMCAAVAHRVRGIALGVLRRDLHGACGNLAYLAGLLYGSLRWTFAERRESAPAPRRGH